MLSKFSDVTDENIFSMLRVYLKCGRSFLSEVESGNFPQSDKSFLLELWQMSQNTKFFVRIAMGI